MKFIFSLLILITFFTGCTSKERASAPTSSLKEKSQLQLTYPSYKMSSSYEGVKVLSFKENKLPRFQIDILIRVGSKNDPHSMEGMTSLLVRMLDVGSKKAMGLKFQEEKEKLGMSFSVALEEDYITISCSSISDFEEEALSLCLDPLVDPHFSKEVFQREKQIALEGLKKATENPDRIISWVWRSWYLGENHPYSHPVEGTQQGIKNITFDNLKFYHLSQMNLDKFSISLVSPSEQSVLLEKTSSSLKALKGNYTKLLATSKKHKNTQRKSAAYTETPSVSKDEKSLKILKPKILLVHSKNTPQSYLIFSHQLWTPETQPDDREKIGMSLVNDYLSGGLSSVLAEEIREKRGLTYSIYSYPDLSRHFPSQFIIRTFTEHSKVKEMVESTLKTLQRVQLKSISAETYQSLRNSRFISLARAYMANVPSFAQTMLRVESGESYFQDKDTVKKYLNYVDSFKGSELQALLKKHIKPEQFHIVIYGVKSLEKDLKDIGELQVEPIEKFLR